MIDSYKDNPEIDLLFLEKELRNLVRTATLHLSIYFFLSIVLGLFTWFLSYYAMIIIVFIATFCYIFLIWLLRLWIYHFWLNETKKLKSIIYEITAKDLNIILETKSGKKPVHSFELQKIHRVRIRRHVLRAIIRGSRTSLAYSMFKIHTGSFVDISFKNGWSSFRHNIYLTPTNVKEFISQLNFRRQRMQ